VLLFQNSVEILHDWKELLLRGKLVTGGGMNMLSMLNVQRGEYGSCLETEYDKEVMTSEQNLRSISFIFHPTPGQYILSIYSFGRKYSLYWFL
jgi:hypothetical protein